MVSVLFVCMGNICRSPSAEGVFLKLLEDNNLLDHVEVDSAGTHDYHVGEQADPRSMKFALKRGVDIAVHRARQVSPEDFESYDYILAMDGDNYKRLRKLCPREHHAKVRLLLEYAPHLDTNEVPDPYYGGADGFERVLDLVEEGARGLLDDILDSHLTHLKQA